MVVYGLGKKITIILENAKKHDFRTYEAPFDIGNNI